MSKKPPWNKGLTKADDPRIAKQARENSQRILSDPKLRGILAERGRKWRKKGGHWTIGKSPEEVRRVYRKILDTKRQRGNLGPTPESCRKAVATRKRNGSYDVVWNRGLSSDTEPRIAGAVEKYKENMNSKPPEEHRVRLRKMVATRRKNGSYPKPRPGRHTPNFKKKLSPMIKERDGFKCWNPECGRVFEPNSGKLDVHHIDYSKTNDDPMNLITLCKACHNRITLIGGQASHPQNQEYWDRVLGGIMKGRFRLIVSLNRDEYSGVVHNLEVETDNSYTANGLVVHNCALSDGEKYPVGSELFSEHMNGMCILVPVLKTPTEMGLKVPPEIENRVWAAQKRMSPTLRDRFFAMNDAGKAKVFGNKKLFRLWKAQKFDLDDLIVRKKGMIYPASARQMETSILARTRSGIRNPATVVSPEFSANPKRLLLNMDPKDRRLPGTVTYDKLPPGSKSMNRKAGLDRFDPNVDLEKIPRAIRLDIRREFGIEAVGNLGDLPAHRFNPVARRLGIDVRKTTQGKLYYTSERGLFKSKIGAVPKKPVVLPVEPIPVRPVGVPEPIGVPLRDVGDLKIGQSKAVRVDGTEIENQMMFVSRIDKDTYRYQFKLSKDVDMNKLGKRFEWQRWSGNSPDYGTFVRTQGFSMEVKGKLRAFIHHDALAGENLAFQRMVVVDVKATTSARAFEIYSKHLVGTPLERSWAVVGVEEERMYRLSRTVWANDPRRAALFDDLVADGTHSRSYESLREFLRLENLELEKLYVKWAEGAKYVETVDGYSALISSNIDYGRVGSLHHAMKFPTDRKLLGDMLSGIHNDGLLSTNRRYVGHNKWIEGMSSKADIGSGGSGNVFVRFSGDAPTSAGVGQAPTFMRFQIGREELDRLDWYWYPKDRFGKVSGSTFRERLSRQGAVREFSAGDNWTPPHPVVPPTSKLFSNEAMFRHGISPNSIKRVVVSTNGEKELILKALRDSGIDSWHGIPLDEFVIVKMWRI